MHVAGRSSREGSNGGAPTWRRTHAPAHGTRRPHRGRPAQPAGHGPRAGPAGPVVALADGYDAEGAKEAGEETRRGYRCCCRYRPCWCCRFRCRRCRVCRPRLLGGRRQRDRPSRPLRVRGGSLPVEAGVSAAAAAAATGTRTGGNFRWKRASGETTPSSPGSEPCLVGVQGFPGGGVGARGRKSVFRPCCRRGGGRGWGETCRR